MSAGEGRTIRELLPSSFDNLDEVIEKDAAARLPGGEGIPQFLWRVIGEKSADAVRDTLNVDIFDEIARAWLTAVELSQYTDEKKYPPEQTQRVFLGKHTVKRELHPVLAIRVGSRDLLKLRFTLELGAEFRSAQLDIRAGRIVALGAGECFVSLQLKYGAHNLHRAITSAKIPLTKPRVLPSRDLRSAGAPPTGPCPCGQR